MAGLFGLIWLGLFGAAKISDAIQDSIEMAEPRFISPETGKPIYVDKDGCHHGANGEGMKTNLYEDQYGRTQVQLVGRRTGAVYEDTGLREETKNQKCKQNAIKEGYGVYSRHHPKFRHCVACDIKTDRFIGAIRREIDLDKTTSNTNRVYICKKYFLASNPVWDSSYDENDFEFITNEEFERIQRSICKTFSVFDEDDYFELKNGYWYFKGSKMIRMERDIEHRREDGEVEILKEGKYYFEWQLDRYNIPY